MKLENISKERLANLFLSVFNDALEAVEPWYQKELIKNLGITKEEADALSIGWIFGNEDEYEQRVKEYSKKYKTELNALRKMVNDYNIEIVVDDEDNEFGPGFNISINDNYLNTYYGYEYAIRIVRCIVQTIKSGNTDISSIYMAAERVPEED